MRNQSLEDIDIDFYGETAKFAAQMTSSASKWTGYFAGYVLRIYHDTKDAMGKASFPQVSLPKISISNPFASLRGVDFRYLLRKTGKDYPIAGDEANSPEFYECLGRDIFEMAKSAKTNENLTIINVSKYRSGGSTG